MTIMSMSRFIEAVVIPSIVGIVVLIGQFFIQPLIVERNIQKTELFRLKQESYIAAIATMNEYVKLIRQGKPKNASEDDQANNVMAKLILSSDNQQISKEFWAILTYEKNENDKFEELLGRRLALVNLFREDSGKSIYKKIND